MSTDQFREIADLLFGGGGDELVHKMNPDGADLSAAQKKDRRTRSITAGLSGIGATAGAAGLGYAGHEFHQGMKAAKKAGKPAFRTALRSKKLAAALFPLEVAGLGGEVLATHILHNDTKKTGALVKKDLGDMLNNASEPKANHSLTHAVLTNPKVQRKGIEYTKKTGGALRRLPAGATGHHKVDKRLETRSRAESVGGHAALGAVIGSAPFVWRMSGTKVHAAGVAGGAAAGAAYGALKPVTHPRKKTEKVKKSDEVEVVWNGEIAKADSDKQQIFGWASVVEMNGEPVVDLQGDAISAEEMEKAGYEYVMKSRKGGDMHMRDNWSPIEKSEMIESFIVTPEKREAMGLPDSMPSGWWVGFQVRDPEVWSKVRSGERTGFSIHGKGRRTPA